ncbi:MAG: hypothetical protein ACNI25_03155 [Halarcobacter sp.]
MKTISESEGYFLLCEFEDGWGMEDIDSEEQLYLYCIEALYIPEEKIEDLNLSDTYCLEINLKDLDKEDLDEDWYVNLLRISKMNNKYSF